MGPKIDSEMILGMFFIDPKKAILLSKGVTFKGLDLRLFLILKKEYPKKGKLLLSEVYPLFKSFFSLTVLLGYIEKAESIIEKDYSFGSPFLIYPPRHAEQLAGLPQAFTYLQVFFVFILPAFSY